MTRYLPLNRIIKIVSILSFQKFIYPCFDIIEVLHNGITHPILGFCSSILFGISSISLWALHDLEIIQVNLDFLSLANGLARSIIYTLTLVFIDLKNLILTGLNTESQLLNMIRETLDWMIPHFHGFINEFNRPARIITFFEVIQVPSSIVLTIQCEDIMNYPSNFAITTHIGNDFYLRQINFPDIETALKCCRYHRESNTWTLYTESLVSIREILREHGATLIQYHWPTGLVWDAEVEVVNRVMDPFLTRLFRAAIEVPLVPQSILTSLVFIGIGFSIPQLVFA